MGCFGERSPLLNKKPLGNSPIPSNTGCTTPAAVIYWRSDPSYIKGSWLSRSHVYINLDTSVHRASNCDGGFGKSQALWGRRRGGVAGEVTPVLRAMN